MSKGNLSVKNLDLNTFIKKYTICILSVTNTGLPKQINIFFVCFLLKLYLVVNGAWLPVVLGHFPASFPSFICSLLLTLLSHSLSALCLSAAEPLDGEEYLDIIGIMRNQAGRYECKASNDVATPDVKYVNVVVNCK